MSRNKRIVRISYIGILVNIILVIFKSFVGFLSNSISIIIDAVNNLTDVLSSIITIIGTSLASKRPDKEHPYGHGRIEYFSAIIISIIILSAGGMGLYESIDKILKHSVADYNLISLIIIFVGIFVKFVLGNFYKKEGKKLNSNSLVASGIDAISDSVLALSTFIGAIINYTLHISLEGYIGIIISIMILKTAYDILKDTVNQMIGVRADADLTKKLVSIVKTYDEVIGVYDLTLHNYGPNNIIGTLHIEIDDKMMAYEIHKLTRHIELDVYNTLGIILTIGIYASSNVKYNDIKKYLIDISSEYKTLLEIHAFCVDEEKKVISFDLVFDFDEKDPIKIKDEIVNRLKEKYSNYNYVVIIDKDYSD